MSCCINLALHPTQSNCTVLMCGARSGTAGVRRVQTKFPKSVTRATDINYVFDETGKASFIEKNVVKPLQIKNRPISAFAHVYGNVDGLLASSWTAGPCEPELFVVDHHEVKRVRRRQAAETGFGLMVQLSVREEQSVSSILLGRWQDGYSQAIRAY